MSVYLRARLSIVKHWISQIKPQVYYIVEGASLVWDGCNEGRDKDFEHRQVSHLLYESSAPPRLDNAHVIILLAIVPLPRRQHWHTKS